MPGGEVMWCVGCGQPWFMCECDEKAGGGEKDYSRDGSQFGDPDSHEGDAK